MASVGSGQRILDLACGTGGVTKLIAERLFGAKDSVIIALDHSASALRQAVEELSDVGDIAIQFVQSQVEQASQSVKDSVDTVIFCNAIHYVSNKDEILNEINNLLRVGGKLALNTSFFNGAHPPETQLFARKWMIKSLRTLRKEYDLTPRRAVKLLLVSRTLADLEESKNVRKKDVDEASEIMGLSDLYFKDII